MNPQRHDASESVWEEAYRRSPEPLFGYEPSTELAEFLKSLPVSGSALDIGCGDGRDTIPLLKRGFRVTAIDRSPAAIQKLRSREDLGAEDRGRLRTEVVDVARFKWPSEAFDLVVAVTVLDHLAASELPRVVDGVLRALRHGGVLFAQVNTNEDPGVTGLAPSSEFSSEIRHYFVGNELLDIFRPHLRIVRYEERVEHDYDHGPHHFHAVAVLLGRKEKG